MTTEYGLEKLLTYATTEEFERHGGYRIVPQEEAADAVLRGVIRRYDYYPIRRADFTIAEYRITIVMTVELYDLVEKRIFWRDDNFVFTQKYSVEGRVSSFQDSRNQAWQEAA